MESSPPPRPAPTKTKQKKDNFLFLQFSSLARTYIPFLFSILTKASSSLMGSFRISDTAQEMSIWFSFFACYCFLFCTTWFSTNALRLRLLSIRLVRSRHSRSSSRSTRRKPEPFDTTTTITTTHHQTRWLYAWILDDGTGFW